MDKRVRENLFTRSRRTSVPLPPSSDTGRSGTPGPRGFRTSTGRTRPDVTTQSRSWGCRTPTSRTSGSRLGSTTTASSTSNRGTCRRSPSQVGPTSSSQEPRSFRRSSAPGHRNEEWWGGRYQRQEGRVGKRLSCGRGRVRQQTTRHTTPEGDRG